MNIIYSRYCCVSFKLLNNCRNQFLANFTAELELKTLHNKFIVHQNICLHKRMMGIELHYFCEMRQLTSLVNDDKRVLRWRAGECLSITPSEIVASVGLMDVAYALQLTLLVTACTVKGVCRLARLIQHVMRWDQASVMRRAVRIVVGCLIMQQHPCNMAAFAQQTACLSACYSVNPYWSALPIFCLSLAASMTNVLISRGRYNCSFDRQTTSLFQLSKRKFDFSRRPFIHPSIEGVGLLCRSAAVFLSSVQCVCVCVCVCVWC